MSGSELRFWGNPWWANEQTVLMWQFVHATGCTKEMKKATDEEGGEEVSDVETQGVTFKHN